MEAILSGAMLIEEDSPETHGLLLPGRDYVSYSGTEDLIEKIRYFQEHPTERAAIAARGCAKANRLYGHRVFWEAVFFNVFGPQKVAS